MDSDQAKLFVGGLPTGTTEATLRDHFTQYGDVAGSTVTKDRVTSIPRGFGFVWFSDPSSADKALQDENFILGRKVDVKRAKPRRGLGYPRNQDPVPLPGPQQVQSSSFESSINFSTRKIFVGGLSPSVTELDFKNYFEKFGRVTDVVVMMDSTTHRPRGFGFITFDLEESGENVMQKNFLELGGKLVEVKRAVSRPLGRAVTTAMQGLSAGHQSSSIYWRVVLLHMEFFPLLHRIMVSEGILVEVFMAVGTLLVCPYGISPIVPQAWMIAYGNPFYPAYMSGGGWVAATGGHNMYNRESETAVNQRGFVSEQDVKSSGVEGEKLDVDGAA